MIGTFDRAERWAACALTLALTFPETASAASRVAREQREVRAIFAVVLRLVKPGDGWSFDMPCVTPERWPDFVAPDGRGRPVRALLTPRQAMDPQGAHPDTFCDFEKRDAAARARAQHGPDGGHVTTADLTLTYPIFSADHTRARLQRVGRNQTWFKNGKTIFAASGGVIHLTKRKGRWIARYEHLWSTE